MTATIRRRIIKDEYFTQFLGGRNCARITIPIITPDQIRVAAIVLKDAGEQLQEIADAGGPRLGQVLGARSVIGHASWRLKGGAHYKGAR